jgi:hypothetical protein
MGERYEVSARAAPHVNRPPPTAPAFSRRECHQRFVGWSVRESGNGAGFAPGRTAERIHDIKYEALLPSLI